MRDKILQLPLGIELSSHLSVVPFLTTMLAYNGVYLAGGAIRGIIESGGNKTLTPEKTDIDLFFSDRDKLNEVKELMEFLEQDSIKYRGDYKKVFECPQGLLTTYKHTQGWKVQFISVDFYESVPQLLSTFDFTCTMFGTDGKTLWFDKRAFTDTLEQRLQWNVITYPASSMRRMMKYAQKGYHMTPESYKEFVEAIHSHSPDIRNTELVYVD